MKNVLVIAAREFEEKRFVAFAAVAFAVLPFVIGLIPMMNGKSPGSAIVVLSVIFATGFTAGLGVITGASFVGRDLADGRMSFYFSRPVGAMSIWFGKLIAGIVLIVGCFGVIAVPARLLREAWKNQWDLQFGNLTAIVVGTAVGLFLVAHVIGTFARSRSPLIIADFAAAVICGVAIHLIVQPLILGLAITLANGLLIALASALVIGIVGGGAWQLERGRTDRRRNHLALSQFLWGTMAVALTIAAGFTAWVVSAKPADLTAKANAAYSSGGSFLTLFGEARNRGDYDAAFLVDVRDGARWSIDPRSNGDVHFTRNGESVVVPRVEGSSRNLVIYRHGVAKPLETGLTISPSDRFFVSDDGNRIATIGNEVISIYDVSQKKSLLSVRGAGDVHGIYRGCFVSPDLFRLHVQGRDGLSIYELDLRARRMTATGAIASSRFVGFSLDPAGSRMLVRRDDADGLTLCDARTGAPIRSVAASSQTILMQRFLRDGRMILVESRGTKMILHLLSPDGAPLRDIPLDIALDRVRYLGDDGERLTFSTWQQNDGRTRSIITVNLVRGIIERTETGPFTWTTTGSFWDDRPPLLPLREVYFGDAAGHIIGWNPSTGVRRVVG
ncbi:MAG: hypothetical protein QOK37_2293 [Thermoanaerobaculia bacterium]|jgi:hypothetical protein|nr:hypothetical protein [Thermoanaerobaculia bacterium]